MDFTLTVDEFSASPLHEGYLASVMFWGTGDGTYCGICRDVTSDRKVSIELGAQELHYSLKRIRCELSASQLRIFPGEPLGDYKNIAISFELSESDFQLLRESLATIVADEHGSVDEHQ